MTKIPLLLMAQELGQGGSERQLAATALGLLAGGRFSPHVGTLREGGFRLREISEAGISRTCFPLSSMAQPSQVLRAGHQLRQYVRQHQIAVVHSYDTPGNLLAAPAAYRAALVITSQRGHRELAHKRDRFLLRLTDRLAHRIVVNCRALEQHLVEDESVPPSKIRLCYNGIDTEQFSPGERQRPEALGREGITVGVVCALRPEKDLLTLADGFARARQHCPTLRLVVVGSGPERERLVNRLHGLGVGAAAHLEPAAAQVAPWLRGIDIFVLPSKSEALSNALMEAMACGCAPVASRVGGNPELVEEGVTGLLFPVGDSGRLAACLVDLVTDESKRRRMAAAALRRIQQEFTLPAAARRMEEIYAEALR
jgi:glycosyltransferase involved in cell wall biosynthesis